MLRVEIDVGNLRDNFRDLEKERQKMKKYSKNKSKT